MMLLGILQAIGAFLGVLGAFLTATANRKVKFAGFIVWLVSNTFLMLWAINIEAYFVCGMQVCFLASNVMGIYNHRKDPPPKIVHVQVLADPKVSDMDLDAMIRAEQDKESLR